MGPFAFHPNGGHLVIQICLPVRPTQKLVGFYDNRFDCVHIYHFWNSSKSNSIGFDRRYAPQYHHSPLIFAMKWHANIATVIRYRIANLWNERAVIVWRKSLRVSRHSDTCLRCQTAMKAAAAHRCARGGKGAGQP